MVVCVYALFFLFFFLFFSGRLRLRLRLRLIEEEKEKRKERDKSFLGCLQGGQEYESTYVFNRNCNHIHNHSMNVFFLPSRSKK